MRNSFSRAALIVCLLLVGANLNLLGCGDDRHRTAGLDAVPAGFALEIVATTSHGARVEAVVVPEAGLFRIELKGEASPASMLITVRTPETQLGYRAQAVLEGKPRPLEMGFLESPLTYSGPYDLHDLAWEGNSCSGIVQEDEPGSDPGGYAARVDEQTGIVVWERQEWDAYRGTIEIARRLVPVASMKLPCPEDVLDYARKDWQETLGQAQTCSFPIYGLNLPGLLLHTLQIGEEVTWVRYATKASPGKIAAELLEYSQTVAAEWPSASEEWHAAWSDDHQMPASGRLLTLNGRSVFIRVYSWASDELGITTTDVDKAFEELGSNISGLSTGEAEAPRLVFDGLMPLPTGADFADTLPLELSQ